VDGVEDQVCGIPRRFRGADDVARFVRAVFGADDAARLERGLLVIGIDEHDELVGVAVQSQRFTARELRAHELRDVAAELSAVALVVAQIEAPDEPVPGLEEALDFVVLASECEDLGTLLLDCVVISGHRWWSLRTRAA
jgi:hypothetical protein